MTSGDVVKTGASTVPSGFILPWEGGQGERLASTRDIGLALERAEPGSFAEYSVCFEAALDEDRPISDRERFMLATHGHDYVEDREGYDAEYDQFEARFKNKVGQFILIKLSQEDGLVYIGRLASPDVEYRTSIGNGAYGSVSIKFADVIFTVIDRERGKLVPEISSDFVDWGARPFVVEERNTWPIYGEDGRFAACEHNGYRSTICLGMKEIMDWQADNPEWTEHVDNMLGAYRTRGINIPVAKQKTFESALQYFNEDELTAK